MELGRKGVFWFTDSLDQTKLIELVQRCEQLGYSALWYPEALRYESFGLGSFLLAHSKKLIIASGIANIYARDPTATKQCQHTLGTLSGGRFLLGLGVSHSLLVEDMRGHQYRRPWRPTGSGRRPNRVKICHPRAFLMCVDLAS